MSTKGTIRSGDSKATGVGFHLYGDALDGMAGRDAVYLELTGVAFDATADGGHARITVTLPRSTAIELGLVAAPGTPERRSSREWLEHRDFSDAVVTDADGWDRGNLSASMAEPITRAEFEERLRRSTVVRT